MGRGILLRKKGSQVTSENNGRGTCVREDKMEKVESYV